MKLFTYLLIDDNIVANLFKPLDPFNEPKYFVENEKNNRIYFCEGAPQIAFMSFRYQNVRRNIFEKVNTPVWAYVIIDNDKSIIRAISKHKNWSTDKDKKVRIESETSYIQVEDTLRGREYSMIPKYLRFGGHLGAGNAGKRECTLHGKILESKQTIRIEYKEFPNRIDKSGNKVKQKKFVYGWPEIIGEKIHHKGHTFDNRVKYLEPVKQKEHSTIHAWEAQNNILRPKKIDFGDSYSKSINCDCDNHKCLECSAVLKIGSEKEFMEFIEELHGNEYKKLEAKRFFDEALKGSKK